MIFIFITVAAIVFVIVFVPETKGLPIEEVENMLERRTLNFMFWQRNLDSDDQLFNQKNVSF
jgi:SP family myo-inositol transporter-like MFS transporter 13